jgi:hypothetical protein
MKTTISALSFFFLIACNCSQNSQETKSKATNQDAIESDLGAFNDSALKLIDYQMLPNIHGLSGIDWMKVDTVWNEGVRLLGVTDHIGKVPSKLLELKLVLSDGKLDTSTTYIKEKLNININAESIRSIGDKLYITSEGNNKITGIFTTDPKGENHKSVFTSKYYNNAGLESLAYDGSYIYTVMEKGDVGAVTIQKLEVSGKVMTNYKYQIEELIPTGGDITGITEMLHYKDNLFLILEREWSGVGAVKSYTEIALRLVELKDDTVIRHKSMDIDSLLGPKLNDNYEGMTWGPDYMGNKTLVLVSDDNGGGNQHTWIVVLAVNEEFLSKK